MKLDKNTMGSDVVEGFRCKPVKGDPERPVMRFNHHLFVCTGGRCSSIEGVDAIADTLREFSHELSLDRGEKRIKVTRSGCMGACRFKSVTALYENSSPSINNCIWLRETHNLSGDAWKEILLMLADGVALGSSRFANRIIPMELVEGEA